MQNPYLQRWTAGATLGGAIKQNKLYFFLGYQRLDSSDAATAFSQMTVPSGLSDDRSADGLMTALTSWNDAKPVPTTGKSAFTGISSPLLSH